MNPDVQHPHLSIRAARPEDVPAIAQLVNAAYRPREGEEGWTHERGIISGRRISPAQVEAALEDSQVLTAWEDARLLACIQVAYVLEERPSGAMNGTESVGAKRVAHIGMLAVEHRDQARGLGKIMLARAEAWARQEKGIREFVLSVVGGRPELVSFYCRRGYRQTGETLPFPVEADVGLPVIDNPDLVVLRKADGDSD